MSQQVWLVWLVGWLIGVFVGVTVLDRIVGGLVGLVERRWHAYPVSTLQSRPRPRNSEL